MTISGHIENGHVVLDSPASWPDGTKVMVLIQPVGAETASDNALPSLYDRLKPVAGKATGLPCDLAINHDHYLHAQPKRQ